MPIVTITSDWCREDYYIGSLKGRVMAVSDDIRVVDISNSIPPFEVLQESFVLRHSYRFFPQGTINLMCVDCEPSDEAAMIIVYSEGYYFVGLNDGRFSHLFDQLPSIAYEVILSEIPRSTFSAPYYFAEAIRTILNNTFLEKTRVCDIKSEVVLSIAYDIDTISGRVIYIDSFGNAVTNISRKNFEKIDRGRYFTIFVNGPLTKVNRIADNYRDAFQGELIALFNSLDYLEIAIRNGNAASIESLAVSSEIRVKFENNDL